MSGCDPIFWLIFTAALCASVNREGTDVAAIILFLLAIIATLVKYWIKSE